MRVVNGWRTTILRPLQVTRGKKLVVLVGTKKALGMAVRRQDTSRRFTDLRRRLIGGADR